MTPEQQRRWPWADRMQATARNSVTRGAERPAATPAAWAASCGCVVLKSHPAPPWRCWCEMRRGGLLFGVVTRDDWGDGPMCVMCGRVENKWGDSDD